MLYKHGEKSSQVLKSVGFENVTFKTYNGYVTPFFLHSHSHSVNQVACVKIVEIIIM